MYIGVLIDILTYSLPRYAIYLTVVLLVADINVIFCNVL